jgi:hypothetical protein
MRRKKSKPNYRKIVLRLPDLDHAEASVLNSLSSARLESRLESGTPDRA